MRWVSATPGWTMRQSTGIPDLAGLVADRDTISVPRDIRRIGSSVLLEVLGSYLAADHAVENRVSPDATLFAGAAATAFRLAATAHSLDLDETHFGSSVHSGSAVVGTLLGLASTGGSVPDGDHLRDAVVVSMEIAARVGLGAPGAAQRRGYTTTAVYAPLASSAAAAWTLGLDHRRTAHALSLATDGAGGTRGGHLDGGADTKFLHMGRSAAWGVACAALAAKGATGAPDPLFGRFGLFRTVLGIAPDEVDQKAILEGIGTRWVVRSVGFKAFATHLGTQACAAELLSVLDERDWREVEAVKCTIPPDLIPTVGEPRESKLRPANGYAARFSLPIVAALCMLDGELHVDSFEERSIRRADVSEIASRVEVVGDPDAPVSRDYPGRIDVRFTDGSLHSSPWRPAPGVPARPLSEADLETKFRSLVEPRCGSRTAALILEEVRGPARSQRLLELVGAAWAAGDAW